MRNNFFRNSIAKKRSGGNSRKIPNFSKRISVYLCSSVANFFPLVNSYLFSLRCSALFAVKSFPFLWPLKLHSDEMLRRNPSSPFRIPFVPSTHTCDFVPKLALPQVTKDAKSSAFQKTGLRVSSLCRYTHRQILLPIPYENRPANKGQAAPPVLASSRSGVASPCAITL